MNKAKRYPREVRERAVRMVFDHEAEWSWSWSCPASVDA